jgi:phosphatidylserine/phosphatidylglycerophosphate/cardiolipin synthase-like enzyme
MRSLSLGVFVCCGFLFFGCTNGYERYETSKNWQKQHLLPITKEAPSSFPHSIWIAPDDRTGDILIDKIHSAKRKISLNVYLLSDERLIDALIEAHRTQILVRIILERSVYANPKGNTSVFARLKHEGVAVIWADEVQQNFNHAKYLIVDDFVFVSTGNFTNTSFHKNREFLVGTSDVSIVSFMDALFDADYNRFPFRSTHPSLYISPIDARKKIEYYLKNAKKHIRVYAVSFTDEQLLVLLESLSAS